jgi:putative aminopeptidase FrvX
MNPTFLRNLLTSPGPSSFESKPAKVWCEQARAYGAKVKSDAYGNSFATFNEGKKPTVMLAGHIDEIGLMITHIDKDGFLYFTKVGGWDAQQLVGQRVRILTHKGQELLGVIGKNPLWHTFAAPTMPEDEHVKVSRVKDLWIDIGASSDALAKQYVRVGDVAVLEQPVIELLGGKLVSKALDNRISSYMILEAAKHAAEEKVSAEIVAVATVQEEIGLLGARIAAYGLEPDVVIAMDVTFATDLPDLKKQDIGDVALGSGANLAIGSSVHRGVFNMLVETADAENIPYTISANPNFTWTDADETAKARSGIPTALVSVPNRYMHSANEMIDPRDAEHIIALVTAFCKRLDATTKFVQP